MRVLLVEDNPELVKLLVKGLGYGALGTNRVMQGLWIREPESSQGGLKWTADFMPGHILLVRDRPACLLDIMSADCEIFHARTLSRIYRTAVHPEVRAPYFLLCNGVDLVLFGTHTIEPVLEIPVCSLAVYWFELCRTLTPNRVFATASSAARDLGVHLLRLGFSSRDRFVFQNVPLYGLNRLSPRRFSFTTVISAPEEEAYLATFELGLHELEQLEDQLAPFRIAQFRKPSNRYLRNSNFVRTNCQVDLKCHLSGEPEENGGEVFLPLLIDQIGKVPAPPCEMPNRRRTDP